MPLTNSGRDAIAQAIVGDSFTAFDNANATIGAGDSNTAFAAAQTDLQASSNKVRKVMEVGYPQRVANVLTFRALFGTGDANWQWNEWGIFNAATDGTMFNRKVEDLGSKTSAQSWLITCDLTINIGT